MARRRQRDLQVGAVFALALIIVAIAVMALGGESRFFSERVRYRVVFPNAEGLGVGSPVKMSGVQVGAVAAIRLSTDPVARGIEVEFGVDRAYSERIREDSRAAMRISSSFLTGERYVEVVPGSPEQPPLAPGSLIEPSQAPEILEQAAATAENLNDITVSLKTILEDLEKGRGLMGQMITDPEFGTAGLEALRGTFENLEALTEDLRQGRGFVGRLLYDEEFSTKIDALGVAIEEIASVASSLDLQSGAVGAMLEEGGAAERAIDDLQVAARSLRAVAARLESTDGLLGRLLNDREFSEATARDLRTILANLAEITGKINRGEGTLGALVNDRTLYDGVEEVVAGVNDSGFARWLMRHYQKKGIKIESKSGDAETPAGPAGP